MKLKIISILKLIRTHQYLKNILIFLPIFFVGEITNIDLFKKSFVAFVAFSLSASFIYILNDFKDIKEDQQHPKKRTRPLASGVISKRIAIILMMILLGTGSTIMALLSFQGFMILALYIILNIAYCFFLKHIALIDVTIISIGFVLRLFIGSAVTGIPLSMWIVIMGFLLALFLALAKRRDDVIIFNATGKKLRKVLDGYDLKLIDGAMVIMASVVIVSYILYTTTNEVIERLQTEYLYLTTLFVILGILRYLQITFIENDSGSPTSIIINDRFIQLTIVGWILSFVWIIYI